MGGVVVGEWVVWTTHPFRDGLALLLALPFKRSNQPEKPMGEDKKKGAGKGRPSQPPKGREHLVLGEVDGKDGKKVGRWIDPNKGEGGVKPPSPEKQKELQQSAADHLRGMVDEVFSDVPTELIPNSEVLVSGFMEMMDKMGWDQPPSLWRVSEPPEGDSVVISPVTVFDGHPADGMVGMTSEGGDIGAILVFEGWGYPEDFSPTEPDGTPSMGLVSPSQHPRRVETRQVMLMDRDGKVTTASHVRDGALSVYGNSDGATIEGKIPDALRSYLQAPFFGETPAPVEARKDNYIGDVMGRVVEDIANNNIPAEFQQETLRSIATFVRALTSGSEGSPPDQLVLEVRQELEASMGPVEKSWDDVRASIAGEARREGNEEYARRVEWLDDAALYSEVKDWDVAVKASTVLSLIDDEGSANELREVLALRGIEVK